MMLCAIDTETTGLDTTSALPVELCILPLNKDFSVDNTKRPFSVLINPGIDKLNQGHEALAFNGIGKDTIIKKGIPGSEIGSMINGWLYAYGETQIIPVAQNWAYDKSILMNLLGYEFVDKTFYRRAKDTMIVATYINDLYKEMGLAEPFTKLSLVNLCQYFKIPDDGAHRAEADCRMTALVYKKLLEFIKNNITLTT